MYPLVCKEALKVCGLLLKLPACDSISSYRPVRPLPGRDAAGTEMPQRLVLPRASRAAPGAAARSKAAEDRGEGAQPGASGPSGKTVLGRNS